MNLSDLITFLSENDLRPKKALSQTFLIDGNILDKLIETGEVTNEDRVLEIGPGPGAITERLLKKGASVIAVEKDPLLGEKLKRLSGTLTSIIGDCMEIDIPSLFPNQKGKVIANIPYQLTAPILAMLLPYHSHLSSLTLIMQKEVALRIVGTPGTKLYSPISMLAQFYSDPKYICTISPNSFYPKPKIDSSIVHFSLRKPPFKCDQERFFHLVRTAFQKRRKIIVGSLKEEIAKEEILAILKKHHLPLTARPENLSLEAFAELALAPPATKTKP